MQHGTVFGIGYVTPDDEHEGRGWYKNRRLHGSLAMVSPNELEADYYAALNREALLA